MCVLRLQLKLAHSNKALLMSGNCLKRVLKLQCFFREAAVQSFLCNVQCFLGRWLAVQKKMTLLLERIDMPPTWARLTPENLTAAAFKRNLYATKEFLEGGIPLTGNSLAK